jgi:hypothetical protein
MLGASISSCNLHTPDISIGRDPVAPIVIYLHNNSKHITIHSGRYCITPSPKSGACRPTYKWRHQDYKLSSSYPMLTYRETYKKNITSLFKQYLHVTFKCIWNWIQCSWQAVSVWSCLRVVRLRCEDGQRCRQHPFVQKLGTASEGSSLAPCSNFVLLQCCIIRGINIRWLSFTLEQAMNILKVPTRWLGTQPRVLHG